MKKILIVTNSLGKIEELQKLFKEEKKEEVTLYTMQDLEIFYEPEEIGKSYAENALIKITSLVEYLTSNHQLNKLKDIDALISDDSGIAIECFNGFPGIKSARFTRTYPSPEYAGKALLFMMNDVEGDDRKAKYITNACVALISRCDDHEIVYKTRQEYGYLHGLVATEPKGENGHGLDRILYIRHLDKTLAEMTSSEKQEVNSRPKAFRKIMQYI